MRCRPRCSRRAQEAILRSGKGQEIVMNQNRFLRRVALTAGMAVASALAIAGCTSPGGSKAAGPGGPGGPVVLRMATVNSDLGYTPQVQYLVDRVRELSAGNLRIDMVYKVGNFAPDAEQRVVRGVATGTFDLGFAGTRIFDTLGVNSFQ